MSVDPSMGVEVLRSLGSTLVDQGLGVGDTSIGIEVVGLVSIDPNMSIGILAPRTMGPSTGVKVPSLGVSLHELVCRYWGLESSLDGSMLGH